MDDPLPTLHTFDDAFHGNLDIFGPGGSLTIPSLEPFIAANLILAPNPWCSQPPAAFYKYPSRGKNPAGRGTDEFVGTIIDGLVDEGVGAADFDEDFEGTTLAEDDFFGAEYLDLPETAATSQFPEDARGEKRKRESESTISHDALGTSISGQLAEPVGVDITWQEGVAKRSRGRPKGSKDSKPRDLSRCHRYRSAQSGYFVPRDHADAVLDSSDGEDGVAIEDGGALRRRILELTGRYCADLADLLEGATAGSVADCMTDPRVSGLVEGVQELASKVPTVLQSPAAMLATPPASSIALDPQSRPATASTDSTLVAEAEGARQKAPSRSLTPSPDV